MHSIFNWRKLVLQLAAAHFGLVGLVRADIFQWEYINPADPSLGKRQSTTLAPDGAGVDAAPGADVSYRNLTKAYLMGANLRDANVFGSKVIDAVLNQANLSNAFLRYANLTNATLNQANLTDANFSAATLSGANFSDAEVRGATFEIFHDLDANRFGTGISLPQLYSTASFHSRDLSAINLTFNILARGDLTGQNLTDARLLYANLSHANLSNANLTNVRFDYARLTGASLGQAKLVNALFLGANLTDADFSGAEIKGATFERYYLFGTSIIWSGTGITPPQLHSTANYQAHDLSGINLTANDLTRANFVGQKLSGTILYGATLTDADFTNAVVNGANFGKHPWYGTGITLAQLYSTASYQAHNLSGISLPYNNLAGGNFAGQNLTNARFDGANLTGADLTGANGFEANLTNADLSQSSLTNAYFHGATLTGVKFTDAEIRGASFAPIIYFPPFAEGLSIGTGITLEQLYSTASYKAHDLGGIGLTGHNLAGANFSKQNLSGATFGTDVHLPSDYGAATATLTGANFTDADLSGARFHNAALTDIHFDGADIRGASFVRNPYISERGTGITPAQLYSTASYRERDLSGTDFGGNLFAGGQLSGQNLTNSSFGNLYYAMNWRTGQPEWQVYYATLTGTDFTAADTRGARYLDLSEATTTNLIHPDGHIAGLNLAAGEKLAAYPGVPIPVHVSGGFSIAPTATFDLTDNDLIVRATAQTKDAMHAEVQALIKSAQNGLDANYITNWDGSGLTSSTARTANVATGFDLIGLGAIRNSDLDITTGLPGSSYASFSGQPVTPDDVLVKYTYIGDGNLDGVVSFDDYVGMDNAFFALIPNLGWATGDINFDGRINFDDYTVVDQAFFFQAEPLSGESDVSAVPEPGTWLLAALASLIGLLAWHCKRDQQCY